MDKNTINCWVCGNDKLLLKKPSDISTGLNSDNFAITNFDYGKTGELKQCSKCGFIQCTDLKEVLNFYEDLEDQEYENTRRERKLQEKKLVKFLGKYKKEGSLLDIGAGSGILVEAAVEAGYRAEGIEPSKWLQGEAAKLNLKVHRGVFPHAATPGPYDVVALVDVIEHVTNPAMLLSDIHKALHESGILILVTPDVKSVAAKVFGYKWWHYRIAHIGYFNKNNLQQIITNQGFSIVKITRPAWYFTLKYLGVRFLSFFPKFMRCPLPSFLEKITVPLNLRDSLLVVCKKDIKNA